MSQPKIARHYQAERNPQGTFFPGVPLRDVTEEEWEAVPDHIRRSVDEQQGERFYLKTGPNKPPKEPKSRAAGAAQRGQGGRFAKKTTPTPDAEVESDREAQSEHTTAPGGEEEE